MLTTIRPRSEGKHFENAALHLADLPACLQNGQRAFQAGQVQRDGDGVAFIHNDATLDRVPAPFQWQLIAATLASTCCQPLDRRMSIWGIPVQGATSLSGVGDIGQSYYYVLTGTATWFEIGRHYIHDGRFRDLSADTTNTGSHQMQVVRRSGVNRSTIKYPEDPSETPTWS